MFLVHDDLSKERQFCDVKNKKSDDAALVQRTYWENSEPYKSGGPHQR